MTAPHCAPHNPSRVPIAPTPTEHDWPRIDVNRLIDKLRAVRLLPADRDVLLAVPVGLLVFFATLALCWPLRHGESLFAALTAL